MDLRACVFIATSLDGFIARPEGDLDWLDAAAAELSEDVDGGYAEFMADVDALVMGRKSFEKVLSFGQWPYGDTEVVVLSRGRIDIPSELPETVRVAAGSPDEICSMLAGEGKRKLYIDGGQTIQGFLAAGRIDELIITVAPVLIGQGISLFGSLPRDIRLELIETRTYPGGMVQLHYRVRTAAPSAAST